jgi:hypothetical protein
MMMQSFITTILSSILPLTTTFALGNAQAAEPKPEDNESPHHSSAVYRRPVEANELKLQKDAMEFRLKREVLTLYSDDETLVRLRNLLNEPWTPSSVKDVARISIENLRDPVRLNPSGMRAIWNLLIYVCVKHEGCEVGASVRIQVDEFYGLLKRHEREWSDIPGSPNIWLGAALNGAIKHYGDASFVDDSFLLWISESGPRYGGMGMLSEHMDEHLLKKLKGFWEKHEWKNVNMKRNFYFLIRDMEQVVRDKARKSSGSSGSSGSTPDK